MSRRQVVAASAAVLAAVTILLIVFVSGRPKPQQDAPGATAPDAPAGAERKITATLYFIAEDGTALVGMQQEVAYGGGVLEQARHILEAQLGRAPASKVPANDRTSPSGNSQSH